jgi:glutaredoxin 3
MVSVEMYTTQTCGSCIRAKRLLASKGVEVTEIDVSYDREPMIERANGRMTVPQIFIADEGIGGYDDLARLDREGKLNSMLGLADDRA